MSEHIVRMSKFGRLSRRQKQKEGRRYVLTPKKYLEQHSLINRIPVLQKRMGYDFEDNGSKVLKYMKEQYRNKMIKYLGDGVFEKKQSRMDKVRIKEQIGFKNQINPLVKVFSRVNKKLQRQILEEPFQILKSLRN